MICRTFADSRPIKSFYDGNEKLNVTVFSFQLDDPDEKDSSDELPVMKEQHNAQN